MIEEIIPAIRLKLKQNIDEKTRSGAVRYFKEAILVYGVKTAIVAKIAKEYYPEVKPLGKDKIFMICEDLLQSDYMEEAFIACEWSYRLHDKYETSDFKVFDRWLSNYINNWAKCDTLCNHTIGAFVEMYPQFVENLKEWTKSDNRWLKRAAAVTLIIPAKNGKFLKDIFEISDSLLTDNDDLVQKGYGWMLKAAAAKHCQEVYDYVSKNKSLMPRTALRYTIEKMPADLKKQAMAK
jgi:3-methyladenine DNA glycosylase AlkD